MEMFNRNDIMKKQMLSIFVLSSVSFANVVAVSESGVIEYEKLDREELFSALEGDDFDTGLIFWNKLGSTEEIENSAVGGAGEKTKGSFVPGVFGNAVELAMNDINGVTLPIDGLNTPVGCLEFWARMSNIPSVMPLVGFCPIFIQAAKPDNSFVPFLYMCRNDGSGSGGIGSVSSLGKIGTGTWGYWTYASAMGSSDITGWQHYAITWNFNGIPGVGNGTRKVAVYVNGVLNSQVGSNRDGPNFYDAPAGTRLGFANVSSDAYLNGSIAYDNLKVWNYAKTDFSDRFDEAAGAPAPEIDLEDGLIAHYPFDGDAQDISVNANHGTVFRATLTEDRFGNVNGAYSFNQQNRTYINMGADESLRVSSAVTMSAWIKNEGQLSPWSAVINKEGEYQIGVRSSDVVSYSVCSGTPGWTAVDNGSIAEQSQWVLITFTYDANAGKMKFYKNGVLAHEADASGNVGDYFGPQYNLDELWVGGRQFDSYDKGYDNCFNGAIDDVRIYNRALHAAEVLALYEADPTARSLTVQQARGEASPVSGVYQYAHDDEVVVSVPAEVVDEGTRYTCTGATVAGNDYAMDGVTSVTLTITNNTTVTWNWDIEYRLIGEMVGNGTLEWAVVPPQVAALSAGDMAGDAGPLWSALNNEWMAVGAIATVRAEPAEGWVFSGWEGDLDDCTPDGQTMVVPMDRPRLVRAIFAPLSVMPLNAYAKLPENKDFGYRQFSGSWYFSNVFGINGLYCDPPNDRQSVMFQSGLRGPGILSFEWELPGADGDSVLECSVGSQLHSVKTTQPPEVVTVAVASGSQRVLWKLERAAGAAELFAIVRNQTWTPLPPAAVPVPADRATLMQRDFTGLAWNGSGESYRLYAGLSPRSLAPVGDGNLAGNAIPAEGLAELIDSANGSAVYWRVDSFVADSIGWTAVSQGDVWSFSVLPEGSPEFDSHEPYVNDTLKVGVFCQLPPFACLNGIDGELQCRALGGRLPAGLKLTVRDNAVHVEGVPTKAGDYVLMLELSVKTGARQTQKGMTRLLMLTVSGLGDIAGAYDGWASGGLHGDGTVGMSVSQKGRITGKMNLAGRSWSFRAPFFNSISNDCCVASVEVQQGRDESFSATLIVAPSGVVQGLCPDDPEALIVMARDRWREKAMRELGVMYGGVYEAALPVKPLGAIGGGALFMDVNARGTGKVRISGEADDGKRLSASTELIWLPPEGEQPGRMFIVTYIPSRNAAGVQGLFGLFEIVCDPMGLQPNRLEEVIPPQWW